MHSLFSKTLKRTITLSTSALLLAQMILPLAAVSATGNSGAPISQDGKTPVIYEASPTYSGGNVSCAQLGYNSGSTRNNYTNGSFAGSWPAGISVTTDGTLVSWASTFGVSAVIVKGGPNANVYTYNPTDMGDSGLSSPINVHPNDPTKNAPYGLSNLTFCWNSAQSGSIKVNKKVDNGQGYADDNPSNLFVWGLDNETPARAMGSTQANVSTGAHSITENTVAGYQFTGWYFTNSTVNSCTNPKATTLPANVTVNAGETRHVTLCNKKLPAGALKVHKAYDAEGDDTYFYDNDGANTLGFRWGADGATPDRLMGLGGILTGVPAGPHTVTENNVSGWTFTGWFYTEAQGQDCNEPLGTTLPANVDVAPEVITQITLCNQKTPRQPKDGSLTIIKDAIPNHEQDFDFDLSGIGEDETDFTLDDDQGAEGADDDHSNTLSFNDLEAGTYTVVEDEENDWKLVSIVCSEGSDTEVTLDQAKVRIELAEGEDVTCIFTNKLKTRLVVVKDASPNGPTDFSFTMTGYDDFLLDDDNDATLPNQKEFANIAPGTYTITEGSLPEGWELEDIDCDGLDDEAFVVDLENRKVTVTIDYGDDVECEFENDQPGGGGGGPGKAKIYGSKFQDDDGDGAWDVNEAGLQNWTIYLYRQCAEAEELNLESLVSLQVVADEDCGDQPIATAQTDEDGAYEFMVDRAGTYKVCEQQVAGWIQTYPGDNVCHLVEVEFPEPYGVFNFGNRPTPGQVLGVTTPVVTVVTPKVLAKTGTSFLQGLLVGSMIIGATSGVTALSRRKQYVASY